MLSIDGSEGEGGGQIVRSSLALSAVTGKPVTLRQIRARRHKPGLRRQHLTSAQALAQLCQAEVNGAQIGSMELSFRPGAICPGEYRFDVGSAGSTTLVLQTVLPALLRAAGPSQLLLIGGTHNPLAPPFEFLDATYLPSLRRLGIEVVARLIRPGFYPAGGGQLRVQVTPCRAWQALNLCQRGQLQRQIVRATVAHLPRHIAERECQTIAQATGWHADHFHVDSLTNSAGPGNVVMIRLECEQITEVFTGFGRRGIPAERVAREALEPAQQYLESGVAVGPHLADQLLLPMGLSAHFAGQESCFRTLTLTTHATTHIEVLKRFLSVEIDVKQLDPQQAEICVRPA